MQTLRISTEELKARRAALFDRFEGAAPQAVVLFRPPAAFYLTGFAFIATERPIAAVVTPPSDGSGSQTVAFVPELEREHAEATAAADRVVAYPEYPDREHPMVALGRLLRELVGGDPVRIAADLDGYPALYGYRGPKLSEVCDGAEIVPCGDLVERMRHVKSAQEVALLRESSRWADVAHGHLQRGCRDGANETDVAVAASQAGTSELLAEHGDAYEPRGWTLLSVSAGFRSQIGPNSALPHAITKNLTMRTGDVLVTGASALMWGYKCELERTMVLGEPSAEQRRFFSLMLGAQETAFQALKPGRRCGDVDQAVRDYFTRHDLQPYWRHHTGHGLGTEIHEGPFLDVGDSTELEPGMVFSIEPGIYVRGLGGFRHSDTAVVTDDGAEYLTRYPRDLDSLTCAP